MFINNKVRRATAFTMKAFFLTGLLLGFATWITSTNGGGRLAQSTQAAVQDEQTARAFAALLAKLQPGGTVQVIVGLRTDVQPEISLPNARAVEGQRLAIALAQDALLNKVSGYNPTSIKRLTTIPFIAMEVNALGLQSLRNANEVLTIEEDVPVPPTLTESVSLIGAPAVWANGFTGAGQHIAVLDTGFDGSHNMLAGKIAAEACFSTTNSISTSVCPGGQSQFIGAGAAGVVPGNPKSYDHGTHVAGIALGKGTTLTGVAKDARLIAIQVFSKFNSSAYCGSTTPCLLSYTSDQALALEHVLKLQTNNGLAVAAANLSLGGGQYTGFCDASNPTMTTKIKNLRAAGIATVVASGNDGYANALNSPACISAAISVGSTTDFGTETVSGFSDSTSFLNLLAPGQWIKSSVPGGGYGNWAGTSMAAPHVAGAWALLKSKVPQAGVTDVLNVLTATGKPITDPKNNITKPRIRVDAAGNALCPYAGYALSPAGKLAGFCATGGNGQVGVTTTAACMWTAGSNTSWIGITSGTNGTGNGTVKYAVQPCWGNQIRYGTMTIAGQTFTVKQDCRCVPVKEGDNPPIGD